MLALLAEAHASGILDQVFEILTSWSHIIAHFVLDIVAGVVLYPVAGKIWRRAVHRHDVEVHGLECNDHDHAT